MSIDALAMAGVDYREYNMNFEIREREYCSHDPHLQLEERPVIKPPSKKCLSIHIDHDDEDVDGAVDRMKAMIREWAKAVILSFSTMYRSSTCTTS
ncbi:hypothetical protein CsatA_013496 [Cannabis sativa]